MENLSLDACYVLALSIDGATGEEIAELLDARGLTKKWQTHILNEAIAYLQEVRDEQA